MIVSNFSTLQLKLAGRGLAGGAVYFSVILEDKQGLLLCQTAGSRLGRDNFVYLLSCVQTSCSWG